MIFWKRSKVGRGGHFRSKNFYFRFWTFKEVFFWTIPKKNCNRIFQKWGGGVKGRLELFRKFILFGTMTCHSESSLSQSCSHVHSYWSFFFISAYLSLSISKWNTTENPQKWTPIICVDQIQDKLRYRRLCATLLNSHAPHVNSLDSQDFSEM